MNAITVAELYARCKIQMLKGNADKTILISSDDEGNSFHQLFFAFADDITAIENLKHEISINATGGITFMDVFELHPLVNGQEKRVVMLKIPAAAVAMPTESGVRTCLCSAILS